MPRGVPNKKAETALTVGEVPSVATTGQTHDTSEDNAALELPHGAPASDPGQVLNNPHLAELQRLHNFLMLNYPSEMGRTNRQTAESPVEVAMRLLSGTSHTTKTPCSQPYCNLPADHGGDHGWVQSGQLS